MTHAEEIALEHIAMRRRSGWSWDAIADEARECLATTGLSMAADLRHAWAIERAFALAWDGLQRERLVG